MDRYIDQLIGDLKEVCNRQIPRPIIEIPPEMEDFREVAEFEFAPEKPISDWVGIEVNIFPAVVLLNDEQLERISIAMEKVFEKLQIGLAIPEGIPARLMYDLFVTLWSKPIPFLSGPGFYFDFCSGDCDEPCRIREYCKTKDLI